LRYFVQFSYNGAAYHGWQNQPNAITVQQVLEQSFTTLLKAPIALVGAGRTDTGVHAKEMFAHFEADELTDIDDLVYRLNAFLPQDIAVKTQNKNPFYFDSAHYVRQPLNVKKMNEAAALLLQYKDFECFSKSNTDVHTYLCDVKKAEWTKKEDLLVFTISADRFLRNMVRAIVGTLLEVGIGKRTLTDVKAVINSKDRRNAGTSVPAKGLYLVQRHRKGI